METKILNAIDEILTNEGVEHTRTGNHEITFRDPAYQGEEAVTVFISRRTKPYSMLKQDAVNLHARKVQRVTKRLARWQGILEQAPGEIARAEREYMALTENNPEK